MKCTEDLTLDRCQIRVGAVYMPPVGSALDQRAGVFECVKKVKADTPKEVCVVFGGDWNSHIGRDGVQGRQALLQPSSVGGKQMLGWLRSEGIWDNLNIVDHGVPLRNRGTWYHNRMKNLYEIDYFIAS